MRCRQRDIVLIPIPFTDLTSAKRRPVIVVSGTEYNDSTGDMLVVALTSNPAAADFSLSITSEDLEAGELRRPSRVRADRVYSLSQGLVTQVFGRVRPGVLRQIRLLLSALTEPDD
ncbi:MAG: type II toxin-antitoxin system PemK/MazF family toxin [Anaerolineae bacterium]